MLEINSFSFPGSRRLVLIWLIFCFFGTSCAMGVEFTTEPLLADVQSGRLSRVLNFTTDVPARATLHVRGPGEAWQVRSEVLRTDHEFPIFGLTFGTDYVVDGLSLTDAEGNLLSTNQSFSISTAPAPEPLPRLIVKESDPDRMEPGYTFFPAGGGHTLAVDAAGVPRWHFGGSVADIHLAPNGQLLGRVNRQILEMDFLGRSSRAWYATGSPPTTIGTSVVPVEANRFHHDVFMIAENGNVLTLDERDRIVENFPLSERDPNAGTGPVRVLYDAVLEIDTDGNIVQDWDLTEILDPLRIGYGTYDSPTTELADWSHSNAVVHDPSDDSIIVSVRTQDAVIKFDRPTGQLKWILGPHDGWGPEWQPFLLEPVGDEFHWPYHTHAPMVLPNGNILIHDNGNFQALPYEEPVGRIDTITRAVEYSIDEETMQITQVWEYGTEADEVMYSPALGDADGLPITDNVLITYGFPNVINRTIRTPVEPRIVEVNRDGEVVFDLALRATTPGFFGVYRSERIPSLYGPEYTIIELEGLRGDFDGNGQVAQEDLDLVLLNWGMPGTPLPENWIGDLPSGTIDQAELDAVLLHWGNSLQLPQAVGVPEPATMLLFAFALSISAGRILRKKA